MVRKHLSSIVYIGLLLAAAVPYGAVLGLAHLPMWATISGAVVTGIVIAVVADPIERAVMRRLEERQIAKDNTR